jgi:hypothetical protein
LGGSLLSAYNAACAGNSFVVKLMFMDFNPLLALPVVFCSFDLRRASSGLLAADIFEFYFFVESTA